MKKTTLTIFALVLSVSAFASTAQTEKTDKAVGKEKSETAQKLKESVKNHFKFYGFIRNYFTYDSHESKAGTGDLFYWTPTDSRPDANGKDLNQINQFRFLSLTSRVGVDVSGYKAGSLEFGAKVEADFYAGLTGSTGTAQLRLRQAFLTMTAEGLGKNKAQKSVLKVGQAWHPMAADMPDIYSLETGAPFGPFSRTPLIQEDYSFGKYWTATAALIWQMQYTSQGPSWDATTGKYKNTASADYMKYGCVPEVYIGISYANKGFLARAGVDVLSIRPRNWEDDATAKSIKAVNRETSVMGFAYLQYKKDLFAIKAKTTLGQAGEHFGLMSGYVDYKDEDGNWAYDPLRVSATWLTLSYGKKYKGAIMAGYSENLGTAKEHVVANTYFNKNGYASINRMFRIEPEFTYNLGKFTVGIEYMLTSAQYGSKVPASGDDVAAVAKAASRGLYTGNLHWVMNHRVQAMVRFTW